MERREFLSSGVHWGSALLGGMAFCGGLGAADAGDLCGQETGEVLKPASAPEARICLFTDHLDDHRYSYADVAKMIRPLNIAGPDLTVRGGGVVAPERAADELPKAFAAFRDQGLQVPMLTTNLTSVDDPHARPILSAMAKLGIAFYKLGYYHYHDLAQWETELETHRKELAGLIEFGSRLGIHAGLHNHAGATIGGALWDGWEFLKPLDPAGVGFYFDPSHATIEGGNHAWKLNFQRISPRLTMIALKDFVWEKTAQG